MSRIPLAYAYYSHMTINSNNSSFYSQKCGSLSARLPVCQLALRSPPQSIRFLIHPQQDQLLPQSDYEVVQFSLQSSLTKSHFSTSRGSCQTCEETTFSSLEGPYMPLQLQIFLFFFQITEVIPYPHVEFVYINHYLCRSSQKIIPSCQPFPPWEI